MWCHVTDALQSSQISLIGSETHSFRYDLTLPRFVSSFSLISELSFSLILTHFIFLIISAHCYANGYLKLGKLAIIALLVLTLPHSNAEEERVFSMINKNKTQRPSLKLDGSLSNRES